MILDATLMLILSMSGADLVPADGSLSDTTVTVDVTAHEAAIADVAADEHAAPTIDANTVATLAVAGSPDNQPVATAVKFPRGVCVDSGSLAHGSTYVDFEVCMQPAYREGAPGLNFVGRF